jgi:L-asparagine oxygenase
VKISAELRREVLHFGWCRLDADPELSVLEIANTLGDPVPSRRGGPLIDLLRILPSSEARTRSLSAIYGQGGFPWHTDMAHLRVPPRFSIIRSLSKPGVRPTLLIDSQYIYQEPADKAALRSELWLVNGGRGRFLTPILNDTIISGEYVFRYDEAVMRPLDPLTRRSVQLMRTLVHREPSITIEWNRGLCVVLDNWRFLHARPEHPKEVEPKRCLERVLVNDRGGSRNALGLRRFMAES